MISAGEAFMIAKECNRSVNELKNIETYIKKAAMEGKYKITLYTSVKFHPKTREELEKFGYKVCMHCTEDVYHYEYLIMWGEE